MTPRCQQFSRTRVLVTLQKVGLAVLGLSCQGCWQEVHYEPDQAAPPTQKMVAVDTVSPSQEEVPAPQKLPMTPEALLGSSEKTRQPPVVEQPVVEERVSELHPEVADPLAIEPPTPEAPSILPPELNEPSVAAEQEVVGPLDLFGNQVDLVLAEPEARSPEATRTALAAWQMSSKWSMSAALQAKGHGLDLYGERLEQAKYGAKLLGVSLPELPSHKEGVDPLAKNLNYLLEDAGPRLAEELSDQHGADHAALAELATKTHVLLLSYTPSSTRLEPVIVAIRQAAQNSGLPESVWKELIDLLATRAEFKQVKAAIYQLHRRATDVLSGKAT